MYDEPVVSEEETPNKLPGTPRIVPREEHCISRKMIDPDCIKVMGRLIRHGYQAFLVGGGVRDLLLGRMPKDFDIGTDARPEEIRRLFRNSRIIGRRFRLIHVFFYGNKIFEVSTFRRDSEPEAELELDEIVPQKSDNEWGDPLTDAFRRDLTINGLFYDLESRAIIDYVGGLDDLEKKTIRTIGDPEIRFREDPVRMIRAVRHAARTGFTIEESTERAIRNSGDLIRTSSGARVYEELFRELQGGFAVQSFQLLHRLGLLGTLLPAVAERITAEGEQTELFHTLKRIDLLTKQKKNLPAGVIFAAILVTGLSESYLENLAKNSAADEETPPEPEGEAELDESTARLKIEKLCQDLINEVLVPLAVPRRDRDIAQGLLFARSALIYSLACEEANEDSRRDRRRLPVPELLPALCDLTGESRLFRPFFRGADFQRTPEARPRRRRRRRRPNREA